VDYFRIPPLAAIDKANPGTGKHVLIDHRYIVYYVVVFESEPLISYGIIKENYQMKMGMPDINVFYNGYVKGYM